MDINLPALPLPHPACDSVYLLRGCMDFELNEIKLPQGKCNLPFHVKTLPKSSRMESEDFKRIGL